MNKDNFDNFCDLLDHTIFKMEGCKEVLDAIAQAAAYSSISEVAIWGVSALAQAIIDEMKKGAEIAFSMKKELQQQKEGNAA